MNQLKGIASFCGQLNLGGVMILEYAPIHWIFPGSFQPILAVWNLQYDLAFLQGGWLKAPILPSKRIWNEEQKDSDQGPYYEQGINAIIPNLKPEVSEEFTQMANMLFIIRLTDTNHQKWILGSLANPLQFFTEGTTGNTGDLKHHKIRFVGRTPQKAFGFTPVL